MTALQTESVAPRITATDVNTEINGEPRILDIRLAEALGFSKPLNIRDLIDRHANSLQEFGELFFRTVRKNTRGRPGKEYWLTEKQALYLCTKSEAPNAIDITIEMVEVFHAVKTGSACLETALSLWRRHMRSKLSSLDCATPAHPRQLSLIG